MTRDAKQALLPLIVVLATMVPPALAGAQTIEERAQLCAACHGEDGIPQQKTMPVIWGQHQGYTYLQLRDFKSGARKNDIMTPLVQTMDRNELLALALYFSQKRWPDLQQAQPPGQAVPQPPQCSSLPHPSDMSPQEPSHVIGTQQFGISTPVGGSHVVSPY